MIDVVACRTECVDSVEFPAVGIRAFNKNRFFPVKFDDLFLMTTDTI